MSATAEIISNRPKSPVARAPSSGKARAGLQVKNKNVASDVRPFIPLTDQTDPRKFEGYKYEEFPKMMLALVEGRHVPFIDQDSGQPIIVYDEDEEAEFRADNPDAVKTPVNSSALNAADRAELEALRAARNAKPTVEDDEEGDNVDEPAKPVNKLAGAVGKPKPPLKARSGAPLPRNLD